MKIEFNRVSLLSVFIMLCLGFYTVYTLNRSIIRESETVSRIDALYQSIDSLENEIAFRNDYIKERRLLIDSLMKLTYDEEGIIDYWDSIRNNVSDSIADKELREYLNRKRALLQ